MFRALAYYVVGAWLLLQAADVLFPAWDIPESGIRYVLYAAILGLPVALLFAWFYDIGPAGIQRTASVADGETQKLRGRDFLLLGALVLVLGAIGYGTLKDVEQGVLAPVPEVVDRPEVPGDVPGNGIPVVAVLPFAASGDAEDSVLFADGVHDDLLTQLSRLSSLRVISRTSVLSYRDVERNIREIGAELGATVVLEGLVRVVGDQIRINAQLIDARTDEHLWAETFDRSLTTANIFEVQGDIARAISTALNAELSPSEQRDLSIVPTSNMAAYRAFRRATGGPGGNMNQPEFVADLERAVELDPGFVQAWAELAGAYSSRSNRPDDDQEMHLQQAENALQQIADQAPGSVEHEYAQAYYLYYALKEYDNALAMANRALERKPSDIRLLQLKSWIERRQGRFEERLDTLRRLIVLDPLTWERQAGLGYQLFLMHRYDEAWEVFQGMGLNQLSSEFGQTQLIIAMLRHRHASDFDAFLDGYRAEIESLSVDASRRQRALIPLWLLAYISRDYEKAMSLIAEMEPYPGWEQIPLEGPAQLGLPTLLAMGDDLRLQAMVAEAQSRFELIAEANPEVVARSDFIQDLALLAAFRGDQAEAVALLKRWEAVSKEDWTQRISFREMVCGIYGMMAMPAEAVACLRMGFKEPSLAVPWMTPYSPEYDAVRESPEFRALIAEIEAEYFSQAEG